MAVGDDEETKNEGKESTILGLKTRDCVLFTLSLSATIQTMENRDPFIALLDSGSSHTWINR